MTKWKRLFNALLVRQDRDKSGDRVLSFIKHALEPSRSFGKTSAFANFRGGVNAVLWFHGLEYGEDGKYHRVSAATTLTFAEQRAGRMRAALSARGTHPDVISARRSELLEKNMFHAVQEATKSIADKLQRRCALTTDGARLADDALGGDSPRLRINAFSTASE